MFKIEYWYGQDTDLQSARSLFLRHPVRGSTTSTNTCTGHLLSWPPMNLQFTWMKMMSALPITALCMTLQQKNRWVSAADRKTKLYFYAIAHIKIPSFFFPRRQFCHWLNSSCITNQYFHFMTIYLASLSNSFYFLYH